MAKEYVLEMSKVIPKEYCQKIIDYFDHDAEDATTTGGGLDKNIRNCTTKSILDTKSFGEKIVTNYVMSKIFEICDIYHKKFNDFRIDRISQLDLLKYEHNQYKAGYDFHTDMGSGCSERQLSISISLNNDYTGGEFVFNFNGEKVQYTQNIGDVIAFPSTFIYPHKVNKIMSGTRYALIGWVV